jgi:hypothetical protein
MTIAKAMKGTTQMNKSTIDMAREAGWTSYDSQDERFKAFEALVRADEREACAEICRQQSNLQLDERVMRGIDMCKELILTRGQA